MRKELHPCYGADSGPLGPSQHQWVANVYMYAFAQCHTVTLVHVKPVVKGLDAILAAPALHFYVMETHRPGGGVSVQCAVRSVIMLLSALQVLAGL